MTTKLMAVALALKKLNASAAKKLLQPFVVNITISLFVGLAKENFAHDSCRLGKSLSCMLGAAMVERVAYPADI